MLIIFLKPSPSSGEDQTAVIEQRSYWGDLQWSRGLCKVRRCHLLLHNTPLPPKHTHTLLDVYE